MRPSSSDEASGTPGWAGLAPGVFGCWPAGKTIEGQKSGCGTFCNFFFAERTFCFLHLPAIVSSRIVE